MDNDKKQELAINFIGEAAQLLEWDITMPDKEKIDYIIIGEPEALKKILEQLKE